MLEPLWTNEKKLVSEKWNTEKELQTREEEEGFNGEEH